MPRGKVAYRGVRRPRKTPDSKINANYDIVAEAEAILAEDSANVLAPATPMPAAFGLAF